MSEAELTQALLRIACLWDATGDPTSNRAANIAREALIAQSAQDAPERRTTAPITALPDYDA